MSEFRTADGRYSVNVPDEWPWPLVVQAVTEAHRREVQVSTEQQRFWWDWAWGDAPKSSGGAGTT